MNLNQAIVLLVLLPANLLLGDRGVDNTLESGATGSDVVQAVIAKLDASSIAFGDDHRFLRRLAFVETADGENNTSSNSGGLWQLHQNKLDVVRTSSELAELRIAVGAVFGIDWGSLTLDDLGKPFLAGLVAKLYLFYLEISGTAVIPLAGNIQAQATFWLQYYHSVQGGVPRTEVYFVEQIDILEEREGCKVNLDIFFVLDGSGSIGATNFDEVRQFEYDFVNNLRVGPNDNQVGTIVFSNDASVIFYLNTYENTNDLLSHILSIGYPGHSTNTADGLCKLVRYGFADGYGARPSSGAVFRIAIVMTDGKSNEGSTECGWGTLEAARVVHELNPPVLVYAIGVTDNVNDEELNAIATGPEFVMRLVSFDPHIIQEAQESHVDEVCRRATLPAETGEEMNGTLDANETVRYHFQVPVAGITVKVCISVGHVTVYGSFSVPNPNSALYDFVLDFEFDSNDTESDICTSTFIDPDKIPPSPGQPIHTSSKALSPPSPTSTPYTPQETPSTSPIPDILTDKIVYLSVVGRADDNNFVLNGSVGDTYPQPSSAAALYLTSTATLFNPKTSVTSTPKPTNPTTTSGISMLIIEVASSVAGLVMIVLLLAFCCFACCCCYVSRKSKSLRVDQYNLLSRNYEGDGIGV